MKALLCEHSATLTLHEECRGGNMAAIAQLLDSGADVEAMPEERRPTVGDVVLIVDGEGKGSLATITKDDHDHEPPRHEQWYELFYDLVLVVACLQIGNLMAHNVYMHHAYKIFVLFSILRMVWVDLVSYQNRFDTPDLLHTMFYGLHGTCAFGIEGSWR